MNFENLIVFLSHKLHSVKLDFSYALYYHIFMVNVNEILKRLILIQTVNPPGNEAACAQEIKKILDEHGISSDILDCGIARANLIADFGSHGEEKELLYYGHMDVVAPGDHWSSDPFVMRSVDGRLYARGSCDMKGGLAAMLAAFIHLKEDRIQLKNNLKLVFVCDEESMNEGFRQLSASGFFLPPIPRYAVVGEPSDNDIAVGHLGVERFWIRCIGRRAHSSKPENGVNAITIAADMIGRVDTYNSRLRCISTPVGSPSAAVTLIQGGDKENVIPDNCRFLIDRRTVYGESTVSVENELQAIIAEAGYTDRSVQIEHFFSLKPALQPASSDFSGDALACMQKINPDACFKPFEAGAEQGLLLDSGVQALLIGPGSLQCAHMPDEYVLEKELYDAERFYYDFAISFLS